jgi:integrase
MASKKPWSYKAGEKGRNRVRVFEDSKTGVIQAEFHESDRVTGTRRRRQVSLNTRDRKVATKKANAMAEAFEDLEARAPDVSLGALFDNYESLVTPTKTVGKQQHDRRTMELFARFFAQRSRPSVPGRITPIRPEERPGEKWAERIHRPVKTLSRVDWDRFIQERSTGVLAPNNGKTVVVDGQRVPARVGPRQVEYDLKFLNSVLTWGTMAGDGRGGKLVPVHPLKGCPYPKNESPARPELFEEEYGAMLARAPEVHELARLAFVLANETGHRGNSIRLLRWSDIDWEGTRVRWRGEFDKQRREHWSVLSPAALEELRRVRQDVGAIGDTWIFPGIKDATKPLAREVLLKWFKRAAELAGVVLRPRLGMHGFRRKAATELDEVPLHTAAELLGMSAMTMMKVYHRPNEQRQREALAARKPLRATGSA